MVAIYCFEGDWYDQTVYTWCCYLSQDSLVPPSERNSYKCSKEATGPLNRKKLIDHINDQAINEPDLPELVPFVAGTVRGKKVGLQPQPAGELKCGTCTVGQWSFPHPFCYCLQLIQPQGLNTDHFTWLQKLPEIYHISKFSWGDTQCPPTPSSCMGLLHSPLETPLNGNQIMSLSRFFYSPFQRLINITDVGIKHNQQKECEKHMYRM